MQIGWLCRWLAFFKANADYVAYCRAKAASDEVTCTRLEAEFGRIAELYIDWGDIRDVPTSYRSAEFTAWKLPRDHLFHDETRVAWVEDPASYVHRPGILLLEIPLADRKSETLLAIEKYLDLFYTYRKRVSRKAAMRIVQQPLPEPKYVLHAPNGKVSKATRGSISKAVYVASLRRQHGVDGKPLSLTGMVLATKQDPKNPFGWMLTEQDEQDIARGVFKKSLYGGSEITLVKRALRDFDAYVRNTIHGRFPDNT